MKAAPSPAPVAGKPEILLAILTDLSVDHRCWKWARALRDAGYEPVILCDKPLHPLGAAWDGFDVRVITRDSHQRRFFPVFLEYLWKSWPVLRRSRARAWVALDAPPLFWLALWGKVFGRAVVYDSHELFLETPLVQGRPSRRLFWTLWENGGFALIRRVVTVSPAILDRLRARHPGARYRLLPNMPRRSGRDDDAPARSAAPPPGPVPLVFQGGLRVNTGLPELFEALKTRPGYTLDVYGGGPEEDALRTAASRAGLDGRVTFHGSIPFEDLPAAMARGVIGVHLMQPVTGSFALTWANKTFDYARALLPVLLSDNPAHRELLGTFRVGVTADSFSPASVGEALDRLVADYPVHLEECRKAREAWHWDAYFRAVPELWET